MNTRKLALGLMITALASMSYTQAAQAEETQAFKHRFPLPVRVAGKIAKFPLQAGSKIVDITNAASERVVCIQLPRPVRPAFTPIRASAAGVHLALLGTFHSQGMFTDRRRSDSPPRAAFNSVVKAMPWFLIGSYAVTRQDLRDLRDVIKGGGDS